MGGLFQGLLIGFIEGFRADLGDEGACLGLTGFVEGFGGLF